MFEVLQKATPVEWLYCECCASRFSSQVNFHVSLLSDERLIRFIVLHNSSLTYNETSSAFLVKHILIIYLIPTTGSFLWARGLLWSHRIHVSYIRFLFGRNLHNYFFILNIYSWLFVTLERLKIWDFGFFYIFKTFASESGSAFSPGCPLTCSSVLCCCLFFFIYHTAALEHRIKWVHTLPNWEVHCLNGNS